ncbi:1-acyl-sn-glycerol-3-phosphate acyltransferase [Lutibacter sp.]|uniref:lysophospholipid acyltransferase family protein n=1 Tax=Lutibacter sp. TaxID=1925666 RepID=UPI001A2E0A79|nr:lysophospholipid acyltransferase family protein [Lutibacter sp.]MBI9041660.1 1-acyl-sn-glycerol-3-phosphate acyltransferase [Lutibacter sp.]
MIILKFLLSFTRLLLFFLLTLSVFCLLAFTNLFYKNKSKKVERGIVFRRTNIRILHYILNSKITVYGKEPLVSGLIISNHRTYFDPIVILKNILAYPIAKKEVESWPLIGNFGKATGVIFVKRNCKYSREESRNQINTVLEKGFSILNTPEGTTHKESTTIRFLPGAFNLAVQLRVPVIPVAIDYKDINDAWVGDDTFIPHFLRCFSKWKTEIKVSYLEPIYSNNADELIIASKKQIDAELIRFRKEWNN